MRVRANQGFVDGTDFSASKEASRREKAAANVGEDDSAFSSDQVRRRIVLNRLFPSFGAARCNDHYLVAFICAETLLFSAKRRECEARKEAELKAHAEAIVIKYLRVCEKNGVVKMWHEMEERYVEQMSRKHIFPRLNFGPDVQSRLCGYYALICMEFYDRLSTIRSRKGNLALVLPTFQQYVPAMLFHMKRGINKQGIEVIPHDALLDLFLPDANTLENYRIQKPILTQARNRLAEIINTLVDQGIVSPKSLQVTTLDFRDLMFSTDSLLDLMEKKRADRTGKKRIRPL